MARPKKSTTTSNDEAADVNVAVYCEDLIDEVEKVSQIQARTLRAMYRHKLRGAELCRVTGLPADHTAREHANALATMANIITAGALHDWQAPADAPGIDPGQSMASYQAQHDAPKSDQGDAHPSKTRAPASD